MDNKHKYMIIGQVVFLVLVLAAVYYLYPKTNVNVSGNFVRFDSINANVIIMSDNPDFSNPRYIDTSELKNFTLNLVPGTYYWKSDNGIIEGISHKFVIESDVGLKINRSENETDLVNIGNVKINVTKDDKGILVGHVILEPDETDEIPDSGNYTGRQEG
jgi:hypothetical protein